MNKIAVSTSENPHGLMLCEFGRLLAAEGWLSDCYCPVYGKAKMVVQLGGSLKPNDVHNGQSLYCWSL